MKTIGYARTSTLDQRAGYDAQIKQLQSAGVEKLFAEQVSALSDDRRELARALDYIREGDGDVLVVTKLDRLARSVADLMRIVEQVKAKGASLKVLDSPIDMTSPYGELILAVLGAITQFEREIMLARQREGIAAAKAEGKYKGRVPTARRQTGRVLELHHDGVPAQEIATRLGIHRSNVYRILADAKAA